MNWVLKEGRRFVHAATTAVAALAALAAEGARQAEVRAAAVAGVLDLAPRLRAAVGLVLGVDPSADEAVQRREVPLGRELAVLLHVRDGARPHDLALGHMEQVRGPALEVVEDVRAIEDRGPTGLGLRLEKAQDALARVDVQVRGDLVHEVHGPWLAENLKKLTPATLAVREVVDQPVKAHLQDLPEVLASCGVDDALPEQVA